MRITLHNGIATAISENNKDVERLISLAMVKDPAIAAPVIRRSKRHYRIDRSPRVCVNCGRSYKGGTGLGQHMRWCKPRATRLEVRSV